MTKEELFDYVHPGDKTTDRAIRDKEFIDEHYEEIISTWEELKTFKNGRTEEELLKDSIKELKINEIKSHMKPISFDPEDRHVYDFKVVVSHTDEVYDYYADCKKPGTVAQEQNWSDEKIVELAIKHGKSEYLIELAKAYEEKSGKIEDDPLNSYTRKIRTNVDELYYQYEIELEEEYKRRGTDVQLPEEKGKIVFGILDKLERGKETVEREKEGSTSKSMTAEELASLPDGEFTKVITEMTSGKEVNDEILKLVASIIKKAGELRNLRRMTKKIEDKQNGKIDETRTDEK